MDANSNLCWGKYDPKSGDRHPLADHCIDVATVFRGLLDLPNMARLELKDVRHRDRLAVVAFLHDFGKCNWGFQAKADPNARHTAGHVIEAVALLTKVSCETWPAAWRELLAEIQEWFATAGAAGSMVLAAVSHHGRPIRWDERDLRHLARFWLPQAGFEPMQGLTGLSLTAREAFPKAFESDIPTIEASPAFQHRFAGLVMLADWIASDTQFFPYRASPGENRSKVAETASAKALAAIGLRPPQPRAPRSLDSSSEFGSVFDWPATAQPTPLQRLLAAELALDDDARLLLVESDTGSGKTEAALAWFFRLYAANKVDGLYFALPTRVAARELYGRVLNAVEATFPPEARPGPVLLAAPGYVRVDGKPVLTDPDGSLWEDDNTLRQRERVWAAERPKRFLAAPIAVGTIDQALLSVLKVKHSLLRSVCLDRHLLVVDEVHASDVYMREILHTLLEGHLARGSWTLLLSATLGESSASRFFRRAPRAIADAIRRPYPSVTTRAAEHAVPSLRPERTIDIELAHTLDDDSPEIEDIVRALEQGARVLVVCNTVGRANTLLRLVEAHLSERAPALLDSLFSLRGVRCPHHGRYARADREQLDAEVSRRLGRTSGIGPLLLIGTQTLEQSLDIDADWLIADLAPMDVLLQRAGRLHRHVRCGRPDAFSLPRMRVRVPGKPLHDYLDRDGKLRAPAGLGLVYPEGRALACTLASLREDRRLRIPEQSRARIEAVTHPDAWAALPAEWQRHASHVEGGELAKIRQALRSVMDDEPFGTLHYGDVDGERVLSRLGDPTYELPLRLLQSSPFGIELDRIPVPARHLRGEKPPEHIVPEAFGDGLRFAIGAHAFRYTRFGLEKDDA